MRRAALALGLALATPAQAETQCERLWSRLSGALADGAAISGKVSPARIAGCLVTDIFVDLPGRHVPDWHADSLHLLGATDWLAGGGTPPDRLEARLTNLRVVVGTGHPQLDYLHGAQARATPIQVSARIGWEAGARVLALEALEVDFPGENRLGLSARLSGVDLSSAAAMQMSLGGFALTEAMLEVQSHGFFESYLLMPLGAAFLPESGDVPAAAEALRNEALAGIAALPDAVVPGPSRAALAALVEELPNPSGRLRVEMSAEPGLGPLRLAGPVLTGMPRTVEAAGALLQGVRFDIAWTHEPAP